MTKTGAAVTQVKIDWKLHTIEYQAVSVFNKTKEGERVYDGIGNEVRKDVDAKVAAWLGKLQSEESD